VLLAGQTPGEAYHQPAPTPFPAYVPEMASVGAQGEHHHESGDSLTEPLLGLNEEGHVRCWRKVH
jgi:hypothetical protein